MPRFLAITVAAMIVAASAGERPARAEGPTRATTATQKATQHYLKGEAYFKARDFSAAMGEYLSGYEEKADPIFIFNVAQCQRLLGHPGPALQSYRRYLSEAPDGAGRAIAEKQAAELQRLVAGSAPSPAAEDDDLSVLGSAPMPLGGSGTPEPGAPPLPEAAPLAGGAASSEEAVSPLVTAAPTALIPIPTAPTAETSSSAGPSESLVAPAEPERSPIYKRWWFWTAAGAVSLFALVAATSSGDRPGCETGRLCR